MQKTKAIKELFKSQDIKNKFKIIKDYDLKIKGFSNITFELLEKNEKYISNQIASTYNIKKILKANRNRMKNEQNLDYLLPIDKIIDKYTDNFEGLITIFEKDEYGVLTENIVNKFTESISFNNCQRTVISDNKEDKLRNIIKSLEGKIRNKEEKINQLNQLNELNKKKIQSYEELLIELKKDIKTKKSEINECNISLQNAMSELSQLKVQSKTKNTINYHMETKKDFVNINNIHIIGAPDFWVSESTGDIQFYNENELDNFIDCYNNNKSKTFYAVRFGITSYATRKIKKQANVNFIDNKEEFKKVEKGEAK